MWYEHCTLYLREYYRYSFVCVCVCSLCKLCILCTCHINAAIFISYTIHSFCEKKEHEHLTKIQGAHALLVRNTSVYLEERY